MSGTGPPVPPARSGSTGAADRPGRHHLAYWSGEHPDWPAIVLSGSGEVTTFRALDERSNRVAHALRSAGLRVGDHLALMMENSSAFLEVAWAAQRSGLHYTAINSHLRPAEVQHILDDCGATAFFASARLEEVAGALSLGGLALRVAVGGGLPGFDPYDEVLHRGEPTPVHDEAEGREMLYSSGTTGVPKGVRKALVPSPPGDPQTPSVQIAMHIGANGVGDGSVYLSPAPLYHAAPLVYSMSAHRLGATVVVMESFDATACLAAIERYRVTHAQFVPTMFTRMLRLPERERLARDLSSLQWVVHAAAPCPVPVKRQMIDWWGPIIHEYYAGTEDIGSAAITPEEWLAHPGSVGRPLGEVHIVGPGGEEVPAGEPGTVYFAGGRPFEYHNDPEKTAGITNARGWRTLGDVGYVDQDGYLYLTDRASDMVVSGGVNIYPREAELVLSAHPAVADVAVFGIPDEEMGETLLGVVEPADASEPPTADELLAWCRERLTAYKCPRSLTFVDAMPRDPSGKLFKRLLRDPYWEGRSTRIV